MEGLITTYGEAKDIIRKDLESMSKKFITIGYYLKYIRDGKLYIQDGFESIWDFAQDTYGISKSTCSRWMHMNDKFSENGNSPELRQEFASFGKSQLQEMLYLDDKQIEQAKPEMTAKEIREIRKPQEENLEGQMSIEDYPDILPEKVPYFRKDGEPYGYTWFQVVKEYLKTAYTEDSAKIKSMGKEYLVLRRPERTFFYDAQGNTLFEVENARLESEYSWLCQKENVAPSQQTGKCIHRQQYVCTLTEEQKAVAGDGKNCNEKCCWNCIKHGNCKYECNASANREEKKIAVEVELEESTEKQQSPVRRGCITGKNSYGNCVCCGNNGTVSCCAQCKESCNSRCGWIEQEPVAPSQQNEETEVQQETEDVEQTPLPKFKNNEQRKEWLKNYRNWGIWYKDEHIDVTYYRYRFENGADLIVEEYENENEYMGAYTSSYFHLVGGPEPPRKSGIPKWTKHEKYNRYPHSETELVEFIKEIQKGEKHE